jgi:hypothetical protein
MVADFLVLCALCVIVHCSRRVRKSRRNHLWYNPLPKSFCPRILLPAVSGFPQYYDSSISVHQR